MVTYVCAYYAFTVYVTRISTVWVYLSVVTVMSVASHSIYAVYCTVGEMTSYHIVKDRTLYHIT